MQRHMIHCCHLKNLLAKWDNVVQGSHRKLGIPVVTQTLTTGFPKEQKPFM